MISSVGPMPGNVIGKGHDGAHRKVDPTDQDYEGHTYSKDQIDRDLCQDVGDVVGGQEMFACDREERDHEQECEANTGIVYDGTDGQLRPPRWG